MPESGGFLKLSGSGLTLSALKRTDAGDRWILRIYNGADHPVDGTVTLSKPLRYITRTNLRDQAVTEQRFDGNSFHVNLGTYEIGTYRIRI